MILASMQVEAIQASAPAPAALGTAGSEIHAVPVCIGFTAVVAQIVLMRELVVVFNGNEISFGVMLATWLLWTAFGGAVLGRPPLPLSPRATVALLLFAVGLAVPATIVLVRSARVRYQVTPGEILGPGTMLLTSVLALAVFCALSGWLFAAAGRLYSRHRGASPARSSGTVYLLEAIGSCMGGLLASILLLRYGTAMQIAFLLVALNSLCAVWVGVQRRRQLAFPAMAAVSVAALALAAPRLDAASQALLWRGFHLLASTDSVYGRLDIVDTGATRTVNENGLAAFHAEDPASAEEAVHFALLQHPHPATVLLIGGGLNGSLAQALQHPSLSSIDYVELDPAIISLAERYFPQHAASLNSPRVRVHSLDGRLFVKTTGSRFDVIIVNLPEPQTAQLNRFYTREFFSEAARKLAPGGVLSFQLRGAENYISPELGEFLRCIHRTLRSVFPDAVVIPGDVVHFSASTRTGTLSIDAQTLLERARERRLQTRYVREYYLPFRLTPDRVRDLQSEMHSRPDTPINTDLSPSAYYFGVTLWSANFGGRYRDLFTWAAGWRFTQLLLIVTVPVLAASIAARRFARTRRGQKSVAALCVGATGTVMMALEVLLLLGFQAIYGYVYYQLAILIAAFMAGMAAGSWLVLRRARPVSVHPYALALLQVAAAGSPLLLYLVLRVLTTTSSSAWLLLASEILFPGLAIIFGALGGCQFQVATRVYFPDEDGSRIGLASLYAVDLLGACLGAIAVSAYLVPVFGKFRTAVLIALAALLPALAALPRSPAPSRPAN